MAPQTPNSTTTQSKKGLLTEILRNGRLAWYLLSDRRVGLARKLIIPGLLGAYLLWPADLLPDVLPVLGQLDDLAILALGIKLFVALCPKGIVQEYRDNLTGGSPSYRPGPDDGPTVDAAYRVVE